MYNNCERCLQLSALITHKIVFIFAKVDQLDGQKNNSIAVLKYRYKDDMTNNTKTKKSLQTHPKSVYYGFLHYL